MKIIKGTFGNAGKVRIDGDRLVIDAARKAQIGAAEIESAIASTEQSRKFGWLGCVAGTALLSLLLVPFMGSLGVLIALALAVVGSFYSTKSNQVEIRLKEGGWLTVQCSYRDMKRLVNLRPWNL